MGLKQSRFKKKCITKHTFICYQRYLGICKVGISNGERVDKRHQRRIGLLTNNSSMKSLKAQKQWSVKSSPLLTPHIYNDNMR